MGFISKCCFERWGTYVTGKWKYSIVLTYEVYFWIYVMYCLDRWGIYFCKCWLERCGILQYSKVNVVLKNEVNIILTGEVRVYYFRCCHKEYYCKCCPEGWGILLYMLSWRMGYITVNFVLKDEVYYSKRCFEGEVLYM